MDHETNTIVAEPPKTEFLVSETEGTIRPATMVKAYAEITALMGSMRIEKSTEPVTAATKLRDVMTWVRRPENKALIEQKRLGWAQDRLITLFDSFGGIFKEMRVRMNEKDSDERMFGMAQFNQMLASDFHTLLLHPELQANRTNADQLTQILQGLMTVDEARPIAQELLMRIAGAKAQAGVMKLCQDNGALVITPDPENIDEVADWDVRAGTDFVVINTNGEVYFVDTKSQATVSFLATGQGQRLLADFNTTENANNPNLKLVEAGLEGYLNDAYLDPETTAERKQIIEQAQQYLKTNKPRTLTVITPTHSEVMDRYGQIFRPENIRDILAQLRMPEVTD